MTKEEDLKDLIQNCRVLVKLERHEQVARLCSQISKKLVELVESSLSINNNQSKLERDNETSLSSSSENDNSYSQGQSTQLLQLVASICKRLRHLSQLASAYEDLTEFVRLHVS